jgi:hypothetical protein
VRPAWLLLAAAACLPALAGALSRPDEAAAIPVFASGGENGSLEPCGCAQNQLGGLSRRATALTTERPDPAAALTLSCGGAVRSTGKLDALTLQTMMGAFASMHYDAHVPSARELRLGAPAVSEALAAGVPWLAANVQPAAPEAPAFAASLGKPIGATTVTVVGLTLPDGDAPTDWTLGDPAAALDKLPAEGPLVIVIAGPLAAARKLAAAAPARALVLVGDAQSPHTSRPLDGHVLATGDRGHVLLRADAAQPAAEPQLIPLGESWPADAGVAMQVSLHRQRIVFEGLLDELYERKDPPGGASYVGSEACSSCHPSAFETWKGSRHGHALESLLPDERHLDPDCLQCHSTGMGFRSGYAGREKTPALARVGCEACHGAGSEHVAKLGRSKLSTQVQCLQCHDAENSPHFLREEYWPRIAHGK